MTRQIHLGLFLYVPGNHIAGWRHPEAEPEGDLDFAHYLRQVQTAERGLFDTVFFQDTSAVGGSEAILKGERERNRQGRAVHLDPASLLPALAVTTQNIGLVSTATTTYNEPFHIARRFATIDHISGGRAGWNLVTSQIEDEAGNFNRDSHMAHGDRYARAAEFYDVVAGLWDSWEDGAFLHDKAGGEYYDADKLHFLQHEGPNFRVRGPLNVARTPQGRPVVAQAGTSEQGREMAARSADIVFTAQLSPDDGRAFRDDIRARLPKFGRSPDDIRILPGLMPIVGRTDEEAQDFAASIDALIPDNAVQALLARHTGGVDLTQFPLDGPLPPLGETNAAKGRQSLLVEIARRKNLTIRQLAHYVGYAGGHLVVIGSPATIADTMQEWVEAGAADGFNLMFPFYPTPLRNFVDLVVPELQRRGIYRTEYKGRTLRENLGLPVPQNRHTTRKESR